MIFHARLRKAINQISNLSGAAVKMPPGFDMQNFQRMWFRIDARAVMAASGVRSRMQSKRPSQVG